MAAGDNLDAEYFRYRRYSEAGAAGDRLLQQMGLDLTGQPLPQIEADTSKALGAATGAVAKTPTSAKGAQQLATPGAKPPGGAGFVTETGRAVVGGVTDAVREMLQTADDLSGWIAEKTGTKKGGAFGNVADIIPKLAENESTVGGMARGVAQFLTGYLTGSKALKTASMGAKVGPMVAGAFSDISAFDPNDPTLSNLLEQLSPNLKGSIVTFLATDPKDSAAENRFKRAIEGMGLGLATDLVFRVAKHWRAARNVKAVEQAFDQAKATPTAAAGPSAASQVDVVRPQQGVDIPVGTTGRGGVMQSERLALPAPGQATLTADEIADNLIKERKARLQLEGNPTLQAVQEAVTIKDNVRSNPTLKAAQETLLRGQSEEEIVERLFQRERATLERILKDQGGETSPDAIYAFGRTAVGAALGFSQGETMEDRIANAVLGGAVGAASGPAIKRIMKALQNVAPKEIAAAKSFDVLPTPTPRQQAQAVKKAASKPVDLISEDAAKKFLEANPDAIEVGKKAIKVNWSEIGDQKQIDDVIKTVTKLNEESIDVARRGVQDDEMRRTLANMLGVTEDDMLKRRSGVALNSEQTQAYVDLYGSAVRELDRLAQAVKAGEPVEMQFRAHLGKTTALTHEIFGARAEAGRALRVWGQAAQEITAGRQLDALTLAGKGTGDVPVDRLADMVLALESPAQKSTFLRQATTLGRSALMEAWINGLLTNPATHVANITSNIGTTINGLIERQIGGMLGKEVARGEAAAMVKGLTGGWLDALKLAGKAFKEGESQLGFSKLDMPHQAAITADNLALSGPIGRAVDLLGMAVRSPGRLLLAADDFFKGINYRMEIHAQAYRQAMKEGGSPERISKRMNALLVDDDFISLAKDAAEGFANYQTFNQQLGKLGSSYMEFANAHPWARFVTPFIRTPVNIAKYTLERTPLLSLAMNQVRSDIAAGGVKRDMALAKMAYGGLMFATAGTMAAAGLITGGGPRDPDLRNILRSTGWQPDSFKIGDKYISYARTDPIGAFFGMASRIVELAGEAKEADLDSMAMAGVLAFKDTFINKTYARGILDAFEAITEPDQRWSSYFEKLGGSFVPAGIAQIERTLDPQLREADGVIETIKSRIPGFSKDLEPRLNIWGDPIMLEGGVGPDLVSPFYVSTRKPDAVSDEMLRLEVSTGMPPKWVFGTRPSSGAFAKREVGEGVELLPKEYTHFVELAAGHGLHGVDKTLKEALTEMIDSDGYKKQSDLVKKMSVERVITRYRDIAQRQLIAETEDLKEAVLSKIDDRKEARQPIGITP